MSLSSIGTADLKQHNTFSFSILTFGIVPGSIPNPMPWFRASTFNLLGHLRPHTWLSASLLCVWYIGDRFIPQVPGIRTLGQVLIVCVQSG